MHRPLPTVLLAAVLITAAGCGSDKPKVEAPAAPAAPPIVEAPKAVIDKLAADAAARKAAAASQEATAAQAAKSAADLAAPKAEPPEPTLEELGFKVDKPEGPFEEWMRQPITINGIGLATPEAALHDTVSDCYYVSNINGSPFDKDGNGFISKVTPEIKIRALRWIDGASPGTELDAPKGMSQ